MKRTIIKKLGKPSVIYLLVFQALCYKVAAQESSTISAAMVPQEVAKIQAAYKNQQHLSFTVQYRYTKADEPAQALDSAGGSFKISGNSYWGTLDSMEFMQNGQYNILLEKETHLIRIAEPQDVYPQVINFSMFDSAARTQPGEKESYLVSTETVGEEKKLTIRFTNPNLPYKECSITYNSLSYLVKKLSYTARNTDEEYNNGEMVTVTAVFSNYSTAVFDGDVFSSSRYFTKEEKSFIARAPYTDYELFVASPNLLN